MSDIIIKKTLRDVQGWPAGQNRHWKKGTQEA